MITIIEISRKQRQGNLYIVPWVCDVFTCGVLFDCFVVGYVHFVMHLHDLLAFGINFLPHSVNLILIILILTLLNRILYAHLSHHHHCHCPSLLLFSTLNSKNTFSLNPSRHRPHPLHRTVFTDTGLLNGFLFSFFSINLLVWFVQ